MDQKPSIPVRRKPTSRLASLGKPPAALTSRRASVAGLTPGTKAQRTSKTSQKLVVLPSDPQTKPLQVEERDDLTLGHETDGGIREYKSAAERMTTDQRKQAGFKRITAYCVAESFRMKLLSTFLKREHNVSPRIFDEAVYAMYHLPLLPGYGPNSNIRSSAMAKRKAGKSILAHLSEAEEMGYQGTYFTSQPLHSPTVPNDGFISTPPLDSRRPLDAERIAQGDGEIDPGFMTEPEVLISSPKLSDPVYPTSPKDPTESGSITDPGIETDPGIYGRNWRNENKEVTIESDSGTVTGHRRRGKEKVKELEEVAEVVFFEYGVVVFFSLQEQQEKDIIEDLGKAGVVKRMLSAEDWEIEECHYAHDPNIAYPRIYNDFFTLKSRSHLLKLSIAHALAQSTLLARYETIAQTVLSSPLTISIPRQLAEKGALRLRRHEALKLTGRLFKLRRDVNLVSNVLDVPELFYNEASMKALYDAVRDYMEIKPRVEVLNEKLGVASDFLDAIHDHLNNNAMERITWIVIWLIVVAILVELGEIIARLVFHNITMNHEGLKTVAVKAIQRLLTGRISRTQDHI